MGSEFTFYDYVDESGVNTISAWLKSLGAKGYAKFDTRILNLEATPKGQWRRPGVDTLSKECGGLFEIRVKVDRVQRRLLGFHLHSNLARRGIWQRDGYGVGFGPFPETGKQANGYLHVGL